MKRSKQFALAGIIAMSLFMISGALAQDPTKVDSTHYKVAFENDQVRVLRITYGPGEKSVMHEHPNAVAVFLTDVQGPIHLSGREDASADHQSRTAALDAGG